MGTGEDMTGQYAKDDPEQKLHDDKALVARLHGVLGLDIKAQYDPGHLQQPPATSPHPDDQAVILKLQQMLESTQSDLEIQKRATEVLQQKLAEAQRTERESSEEQ